MNAPTRLQVVAPGHDTRPQRAPATDRAWLTVEEAARELGIGQSHLRKLIAAGDVPARRFGRLVRIPRSAIDPA